MGKSKFILVAFVMLMSGFAHAAYSGQVTASKILRQAAIKVPQDLGITFLRMSRILDNTRILVAPEGTEFTRCGENTLAYVVPAISRDIHLCRLGLAQSKKAIAQTLIHEAAHLIGYMNECDASILEAAAMRASGEGLAYRNGYMDSCGI